MAKVFNAGDVLAAADLNTNMLQPHTGTTATRFIVASTTFNWSGSVNAVAVTVNYGVTFTTVIGVFPSYQNGSNFDYPANVTSFTTSSCVIRVGNPAGTNAPSASGHIVRVFVVGIP